MMKFIYKYIRNGEGFHIISMSIDLGMGQALKKLMNYLNLWENEKEILKLKNLSYDNMKNMMNIVELCALNHELSNENTKFIEVFHKKYN